MEEFVMIDLNNFDVCNNKQHRSLDNWTGPAI